MYALHYIIIISESYLLILESSHAIPEGAGIFGITTSFQG